MKDRVKELRRVPASELRANPKNWRRHPPAQAAALRGVLDDIGFADAVIARETDAGLELIDGHLRQEVMGDQVVPVLVVDVTEEEADLMLATLDPLAAMATADQESLSTLLASVATENKAVQELLSYIDQGMVPGFEPLGMWEPEIGDVPSIHATDEEIQDRFVVRCPMSESDQVKTELEQIAVRYPGVTIA